MTIWEEQARKIILEYTSCRTTAERITYVEHLGDRGTDLAILEEILRFAVIGSVAIARNLKMLQRIKNKLSQWHYWK